MLKQAWENEPILITNLILGVIGTGLATLIAMNVIMITVEQSGTLMAFFTAMAALVNAVYARSKVTPLAHPKNDAGQSLVPE